jgi:uncharacterized RDD family membrane protein YckC
MMGKAAATEGAGVAELSAEVLSVETPESVAFAYELAGLGSRGIAFAVDTLVLGAIMLAEAVVVGGAFVLVYYLTRRNLLETGGAWVLAGLLVLLFVTYWGYFVFGEVARGGRTPGKRALGIRVVRDDGSRVGAIDSLLRNFLRIVDAMPGLYAVGITSVLLSRKQKRLGDYVAGTVVIRDSGELTLLSDGGDSAERDPLARDFLRRRGEMTPEARYQVGVAILAVYGEEPGYWDEPTIAGRLAQLAGWAPPE